MQTGKVGKFLAEGANVKAVRALMIGLAALVVLAVSGYGTVIYIQLMGKVFPTGPLLIACYIGAAANFLLMLVLLVGKFAWFRPGAHEVASWIVTGVELGVTILNMMLAFQLASGQVLTSVMAAWYYLAPVSPVFSMMGAIALIMTSTELRTKHRAMELQEQKDQAEREFDLAMHEAEMEVKYKYVGFIKAKLQTELNAPERHEEMEDHAAMLVSDVLSGISGLQSVPRLKGPGKMVPSLPPGRLSEDGEMEEDDLWLARVNQRIEAERERRLAREAAARQGVEHEEAETDEVNSARAEVPTERLTRLAAAAAAKGYSLEKLEQLLGVSSVGHENGGDGAKKK